MLGRKPMMTAMGYWKEAVGHSWGWGSGACVLWKSRLPSFWVLSSGHMDPHTDLTSLLYPEVDCPFRS